MTVKPEAATDAPGLWTRAARFVFLLLFAVGGLAACDSESGGGGGQGEAVGDVVPGAGPDRDGGHDLAPPPPDTGGSGGGDTVGAVGCGLAPPPADFEYPPGPYGAQEGDTFPDFVFQDCAGADVPLADVVGGARLTLVNVGAGWCQGCVEEAERMEDDVFRRFCGQGLRVVQILVEDAGGRPADGTFCSEWRETFGLTFPVVVDPNGEIATGVDTSALPLNLLVAPDGEVVWRSLGAPPPTFFDRIEALLAP